MLQRVGFFGWSAVERRSLPPCPSTAHGRCSRTHVRKRGSDAAVRRSPVCHVTSRYKSWKCAAVVCESLHVLPNIPSRHCRVAANRDTPGIIGIVQSMLHVYRWAVCRCATRASAVLPRRHHTTVEGLCVSGGGPGYLGSLGSLPLVRSNLVKK